MILKTVLTILGWLKENLLGVVTLAVGLWVAWRIYRLQKRDNDKVRMKQEASLAEMVILIISEITDRAVTPEVEKKVKRGGQEGIWR
jgi:predicted negative regulator of RcsB-dependent stress response